MSDNNLFIEGSVVCVTEGLVKEKQPFSIFRPVVRILRRFRGWLNNRGEECEVGIHFDMTGMTHEQREKLWQAQMLLHEIGIGFDTGAGGGQRDWEWDWSLCGPVKVTFRCFTKHDRKNRYTRTHSNSIEGKPVEKALIMQLLGA